MRNSLHACVFILLIANLLSACGGNSGSPGNSNGPGKSQPANRVNWSAVPSEFNPRQEDVNFLTNGVEKLNVDLFGFDDDVEIIYSAETLPNTGSLRIFKV